MPGYHSPKEKRQAAHVKESELKRGKSEEEATRIAWATVNSERGDKKSSMWSRFRGKK
jgi:hypothetical protein